MSKLIDGTPLHSMGSILNDIQKSVARSAGYGEGGGVEDQGEVEEVSEEVGRGRKKGREGAKRKRTDDDGSQNILKRKSTPKKWEMRDVQHRRSTETF